MDTDDDKVTDDVSVSSGDRKSRDRKARKDKVKPLTKVIEFLGIVFFSLAYINNNNLLILCTNETTD